MSHAKGKKESVAISARIEERTFERHEKFCKDSGLGKTVTLERALDLYMDDYYGKIGQSLIYLESSSGQAVLASDSNSYEKL